MKPMNMIGAVIMALVLTVPAHAGGPGKQERYWHKFAEAKHELIQVWRRDASDEAYKEAIFKVGKYQTYLLAAHVRPDDERLLGRLANGRGFTLKTAYDYPIFAYRVFKYELHRLTGFEPHPEHLLRGRTFTIYQLNTP